MQIWPAIDILGGRCVRLQQGDYQRETVFAEDPVQMAQHWVEQGADCLHLVDLDGARDGRVVNRQAIRSIVEAISPDAHLDPAQFSDALTKTHHAIHGAMAKTASARWMVWSASGTSRLRRATSRKLNVTSHARTGC